MHGLPSSHVAAHGSKVTTLSVLVESVTLSLKAKSTTVSFGIDATTVPALVIPATDTTYAGPSPVTVAASVPPTVDPANDTFRR